MAGVPLQLSQTKPDFESLVLQLQLFLNTRATWSDLLTSSTGQTLIELMAAVGTFNQFAIEVAAREGFLDTAVRESSIYAITKMLGVRINRKSPAGCDVSLTRTGDLTYTRMLPRFTQFTIEGLSFFNRFPIMFEAGSATATARLFEGSLKVQTFPADSTAFREIYLNEPGFNVSNEDIEVVLVSSASNEPELWTVIDDGIWTAGAADKVYYDATAGDGDAILAFGDGYSGTLPSIGSNIQISYIVTNGAIGNNGGAALEVKCVQFDNVSGVSTTKISGGSNEKPASYYKAMAPHIFRAKKRAVNPMDYKAIASDYPGVAAVAIQAQKDIAPGDLRWMNVVRICILPQEGVALSDSEWAAFKLWFKKKAHTAVEIQQYNPEKRIVDIDITLALRASAIPEEVVPEVDANIRALFAREVNTLGKRIAVSDIVDAARLDSVDYVDLKAPLKDLVTDIVRGKATPLQYFEIGTLKIGTRYSERASASVRR